MARRVCAEPGCPTLTSGGRCQRHRRESPTYTERDWTERKRRAAVVAEHVARNGWTCPGWPASGHEPHPSTDLTAHHWQQPVSQGGVSGALAVLCRSENSRLGDR